MFFIDVEFSCQDEEVVAEAVNVCDSLFIDDGSFFDEPQDGAFGSSADGAAYVCYGCGTASSRQYETAEWGQGGIDAIDFFFHACDHLWGDDVVGSHLSLAVVGGEVASEDEEVVLHVGEELQVVRVGAVGDEESDLGAQFIDCAV